MDKTERKEMMKSLIEDGFENTHLKKNGVTIEEVLKDKSLRKAHVYYLIECVVYVIANDEFRFGVQMISSDGGIQAYNMTYSLSRKYIVVVDRISGFDCFPKVDTVDNLIDYLYKKELLIWNTIQSFCLNNNIEI